MRASERVEVGSTDADRVDDADVGQFASFAQPVRGRSADPQLFGYISDAQQPISPTVKRDQVRSRRCCRNLRRRSRRERGSDFG